MRTESRTWIDREFDFDFPTEHYPEFLNRLRAAPDRMASIVETLSRERLVRREGSGWSIQEHAGHLLDLEELALGRLDDYDAGIDFLRPADMTNRKTWEANHNASDIRDIVADFRRERGIVVARLEALLPEDFARTAIHPRLHRPMRIVDWMYFTAAHDDHHLRRMTELAERLV